MSSGFNQRSRGIYKRLRSWLKELHCTTVVSQLREAAPRIPRMHADVVLYTTYRLRVVAAVYAKLLVIVIGFGADRLIQQRYSDSTSSTPLDFQSLTA